MSSHVPMCSHAATCDATPFYDIDGKPYCRTHAHVPMGTCEVVKRDGGVCGCRARRSRNGVNTCLTHIPKSLEVVGCSICLDDCPIGTKPTKCGHFFHRRCMNQWKEQENGHTCPMCRVVIRSRPEPSVVLIDRLTEFAQASEDADMFIQNILTHISPTELDRVLEIIRGA
jgi:hypothetical protein